MPLLIWSVIILSAIGTTVGLNRRKRRKFAELAAQIAESGVSDVSVSFTPSPAIAHDALIMGITPQNFP